MKGITTMRNKMKFDGAAILVAALGCCGESAGGREGDSCRTEHGCIDGLRCVIEGDESVGTCVSDTPPGTPGTTTLGAVSGPSTTGSTGSSGATGSTGSAGSAGSPGEGTTAATTSACECTRAADCGSGAWVCNACTCLPSGMGETTSVDEPPGDADGSDDDDAGESDAETTLSVGSSTSGFPDCGACSLPHAQTDCNEDGECVIVSCDEGFDDCDGDERNGCEANTESDWQHCAQCDNACEAGFRCEESLCTEGLDLLLMTSSDASLDHVRNMLISTDAFNIIDAFNAGDTLPILQNLIRYDAVLVWGVSRTGLGELLAEYFRAGGTVVAPFRLFSGTESEFGELYTFIRDDATSSCSTCSLGVIEDPDSPILRGVETFSTNGMYIVPGQLRNGGEVVAYWSNGVPMIVVGTVIGRRRVDLNLSPHSTAYESRGWDEDTDGLRLLQNALLYR